MARKPEIKNDHSTQIIEKLSDIKSPFHGLSQSQIVEIAVRFGISLPFKYIEGVKCRDCLIEYAEHFSIDNQNFKIVPSGNALRIYAE